MRSFPRPDPSPVGLEARTAFANTFERWVEAGGRVCEARSQIEGTALIGLLDHQDDAADALEPGANALFKMLRSAVFGVPETLSAELDFHCQGKNSRARPGIWISSSGTTGRPKAVFWDWESLLRGVALGALEQRFDVCVHYPLPYFSALQGLLYAIAFGRSIFYDPSDLADQANFGETGAHLLGTPSFFRMRIHSDCWRSDLGSIRLIAMGGEPATAALLNRLRDLAPSARIAHTYATSEHGSLFSVTDMQAGFPSAFLGRPLRNGKSLEILDGQLFVKEGASLHPTGDLVVLQGDRVLFAGRSGNTASVAGRIVDIGRIEAVLAHDDRVLAVRVQDYPSAASGSVLVAHVQAVAGVDEDQLGRDLRAAADFGLSSAERPRLYRFHHALPSSPSGKIPLRL